MTVELDEVDMLSEFSQDPDPKLAQKDIMEYKQLIKSLRAGTQNKLTQD